MFAVRNWKGPISTSFERLREASSDLQIFRNASKCLEMLRDARKEQDALPHVMLEKIVAVNAFTATLPWLYIQKQLVQNRYDKI